MVWYCFYFTCALRPLRARISGTPQGPNTHPTTQRPVEVSKDRGKLREGGICLTYDAWAELATINAAQYGVGTVNIFFNFSIFGPFVFQLFLEHGWFLENYLWKKHEDCIHFFKSRGKRIIFLLFWKIFGCQDVFLQCGLKAAINSLMANWSLCIPAYRGKECPSARKL